MELLGNQSCAKDWYKEQYDSYQQQWCCVPWNEYEIQALTHYRKATNNANAGFIHVIYSELGPVGWHTYDATRERNNINKSNTIKPLSGLLLSNATGTRSNSSGDKGRGSHGSHSSGRGKNDLFDLTASVDAAVTESSNQEEEHLRALLRGSPARWSRTPDPSYHQLQWVPRDAVYQDEDDQHWHQRTTTTTGMSITSQYNLLTNMYHVHY